LERAEAARIEGMAVRGTFACMQCDAIVVLWGFFDSGDGRQIDRFRGDHAPRRRSVLRVARKLVAWLQANPSRRRRIGSTCRRIVHSFRFPFAWSSIENNNDSHY
jgi:hypothetical protein